MTRIINLTPHTIVIIVGENKKEIPSSGTVRLAESTFPAGEIDGIPIVYKQYWSTELPPPNKNLYIVSAMVRQAFPNRKDLVSPGDLLRDENGSVIGCRNLISN